MPSRPVLTLCLARRPDYAREVLQALAGCDGVGDYLLLPHVEPGDEEVRALVESIDFAACQPTFNRHRLGVNANTENALLDGFGASNFVIHLEDDIVPAPDALTYFAWCGERYAADPRVFSVTAYNRRSEPAPVEDYHRVGLRPWFHPWGWATWRDRWEKFSGRFRASPTGWDVLLNTLFCDGGQNLRRNEVFPELSRVQNIGKVSTISRRTEAEFFRDMHLRHWAGGVEVEPGPFRES